LITSTSVIFNVPAPESFIRRAYLRSGIIYPPERETKERLLRPNSALDELDQRSADTLDVDRHFVARHHPLRLNHAPKHHHFAGFQVRATLGE